MRDAGNWIKHLFIKKARLFLECLIVIEKEEKKKLRI